VTTPLDLPPLTPGFASRTRAAAVEGERALEAAAAALAAQLAAPVRIAATASPAPWAPGAGAARIAFECSALPAVGCLEVEARFASRLVDLLAGGCGDAAAALALTPLELAVLELLSVLGLDAALAVPGLAALSPRILRGTAVPDRGAAVVELAISVGEVRGRARLAIPAEAVRRLAAGCEAEGVVATPVRIDAALCRGTATLGRDDARGLAPGDAVLLDDGAPAERIVLPGGFALQGRRDAEGFVVEGAVMNEWSGAFPIALAVEVARVTIAVSDLARLEPGGVLPLHVGREGDVVLRAGERAVARGRLVDVDGALAVRVDALEGCP
jgi:type III secretion protein Q